MIVTVIDIDLAGQVGRLEPVFSEPILRIEGMMKPTLSTKSNTISDIAWQ